MRKRELLVSALRAAGNVLAAGLWRLAFQPESDPYPAVQRTPAHASSWYETCQRTALRARDLRTKGPDHGR